MKKLLSIFCCVLYMHSIGKTSELRISSTKLSGEKVLVKALAAIVNREGKKKTPFRRVNLCSSESPWV
ncbi:MAG TPA: hypothetical protein VGQ09_17190 [Chitinophagaceae bacterium]|nr:hypothetical protein [Chitinophagaceae bacterium]